MTFILQLFENKANSIFGYLEAGRVTPVLAWHGYRGCLCLCLRLAGSSVLQIGGGKRVHTRPGGGGGAGFNLGSSVGLYLTDDYVCLYIHEDHSTGA